MPTATATDTSRTGPVTSGQTDDQPFVHRPIRPSQKTQSLGTVAKVAESDWAPSILIFVLDIALWIGLYSFLSFLRHDAYFSSSFERAVIDVIQLAVIVQCLFIIGGYNSRTETLGLAYTAEHILAMIAALAVSALILYTAATFDQTMKPSRSAILASFIIFTPLSLLYRRAFRTRFATTSANRAFLVIGAGEIASSFYKAYRSAPNPQRLEFVDVDQSRVGQRIAGPESPVIEGDLASKLSAIRRYSGIILAEGLDRLRPELLERLVRTQFQRTRVYTLESFYEAQWRYVPIHSIDPFWPLQTGFQQLSRNSPYHYVKRIVDLVASLLLLVISFPLMVLIALVLRLTNGSPVIFKQLRVGRDEHLFTIYKFRTMRMAGSVEQGAGSGERTEDTGQRTEDGGGLSTSPADESAVADLNTQLSTNADAGDDIYTRKNDPRVTRVGRFLRKLRLDELPQLWNVFSGELSLIGPRAEWFQCAERYQKKIPFYHFRHLVKPGITGWAQVNYPYGESDDDAVEKLKYDLYYIRHYSLTLDAMIVLKTIYTMLFGKGR